MPDDLAALPVPPVVAAWHEVARTRDLSGLDALVADDCVFCSPAVHRPQEGKALTVAYLTAAVVVLGPTLSYHRQWYGGTDPASAVLEFTARLDAADGRTVDVHGVDLLAWEPRDGVDRLVEFSVVVRPLRGLERLIELMTAQLRS